LLNSLIVFFVKINFIVKRHVFGVSLLHVSSRNLIIFQLHSFYSEKTSINAWKSKMTCRNRTRNRTRKYIFTCCYLTIKECCSNWKVLVLYLACLGSGSLSDQLLGILIHLGKVVHVILRFLDFLLCLDHLFLQGLSFSCLLPHPLQMESDEIPHHPSLEQADCQQAVDSWK